MQYSVSLQNSGVRMELGFASSQSCAVVASYELAEPGSAQYRSGDAFSSPQPSPSASTLYSSCPYVSESSSSVSVSQSLSLSSQISCAFGLMSPSTSSQSPPTSPIGTDRTEHARGVAPNPSESSSGSRRRRRQVIVRPSIASQSLSMPSQSSPRRD